jgi:hypothetical protein
MGKKVRVHVKGTVVDGNTQIMEDDFEEWVCLKDVSVFIGKDEITQSDQWGNFAFKTLVDLNNIDSNNIHISFGKDRYTLLEVNINVPDCVMSNSLVYLVKLLPISLNT